jgi:hypothetical protein
MHENKPIVGPTFKSLLVLSNRYSFSDGVADNMHINICSLFAVPGPKVRLVQCDTGTLLHC